MEIFYQGLPLKEVGNRTIAFDVDKGITKLAKIGKPDLFKSSPTNHLANFYQILDSY